MSTPDGDETNLCDAELNLKSQNPYKNAPICTDRDTLIYVCILSSRRLPWLLLFTDFLFYYIFFISNLVYCDEFSQGEDPSDLLPSWRPTSSDHRSQLRSWTSIHGGEEG